MDEDVQKFIAFWDSGLGFQVMKREGRFLEKNLKDCKTILDVGCGIGIFEQKLPSLGLVGLDSNPAMIAEAQQRSNKPFHVGDAARLAFPSSSTDAVLYVTTLEFIDDYLEVIREGWRVTKNDGKVLAMMLNPDSSYFKDHLGDKNSYFHRVKHRPREIKECLAGFYSIFNESRMLCIRGGKVSDTRDRKEAAVYAVVGKKKIPHKDYSI